jgi:hypothetical protein
MRQLLRQRQERTRVALGSTGTIRLVDFQQSDASGASVALHKRHINDLIRESQIQESLQEPPSTAIAFLCECPSPSCLRTVWLSADEYTLHRASPAWAVRAQGHGSVPIAVPVPADG